MLQRWNRLSFRIPAIVLAMTLLPTLLVGLIAARISRTALTQKVAVSNLGIAADEIAEIDFWLHHTAEVLQVAATRPTFGSADRDMEKLRSALEPLLKVLPSAEKLTVLDESGMELVILSRDEVFTSADYESRAAEPAVRRALNGEVDFGQTAVTPDGTAYRTITVPIWNVRRDTAVGVLQAEFSLAELINQIATRSVGENGYLVVLNQERRIISHPDFSRVLAGEIYSTHLQEGQVVYDDADGVEMRRWRDGERGERFSVFAESDDGAWTVVVEQPVDEALREAALWDQTLLVLSLVILLFVLLLGWQLTRTFSRPLREVTTAALGIARGELIRPPQTVRNDEIGQLAEAFRATNAYLAKAVAQADAIAAGDFSAEITPRSTDDVLGIALQRMTETLQQAGEVAQAVAAGNTAVQIPVKGENDMLATAVNRMTALLGETAAQADAIAAGEYDLEITPRSEADLLGHALQRMVRQLRQVTAENGRRLWMATGQSELSAAMRGITAVDELAQAIVTYLSQYLGAQMGALYVSAGAQQLRLAGKFAFVDAAEVPERFLFGDGLVGQVAADQMPLHLAPVPADYFHIHSGLGDALPAQLIIFPFHFAGAVQGVVELATTAEWGEKELEFLHDVAETVAISLRVAGEQAKNARLLQQTQEQAEELRQRAEEMSAQQEELRQTNEQLVMQTKALQDSEKALQTQQEELRATNEELEEKTEMLQRQQEVVEAKNDQLLQTQRELEERAEQLAITSKYKSEFLSNMSHELRTPLNSLLILARMLQDNEEGNLTAEQIESIAVIYESGQDLLQLINEILDLAKVEAGKVEAYLEMVSLADLLTTMARKYTHIGEEKGVDFVTELDPELPAMLQTDGKRVEQILRNLLSNAFKFTTEGTVTLRIAQPASANPELRAHGLDPEQSVAISVRDSGIGISSADQKMVFEAFQQVDGTISRKYGGTGLGLSISRELATLLGGFIGLESELGVGSTFTLYLPFAAPQAAVASPERAESLPAPPRRRRMGARRRARPCLMIGRRSSKEIAFC
jgi:signal transduction histidine kinase